MRVVCALIVASIVCGCVSVPPASLYDELGEEAGIASILDEMLFLVSRDARTRQYFEGVDLDRLHGQLTAHLCHITGGPCQYTGADMRKAHRGLGINRAHFNVMVESLTDSLQVHSVPIPVQNRLLALLRPFYADVVEAAG